MATVGFQSFPPNSASFDDRERIVINYAKSLDGNVLEQLESEEIVTELMKLYAPHKIAPDWGSLEVEFADNFGQEDSVVSVDARFSVPVAGPVECMPRGLWQEETSISGISIVRMTFTVDIEDNLDSGVHESRTQEVKDIWVSKIEENASIANAEIGAVCERMQARLLEVVRQRRKVHLASRSAARAVGIAIYQDEVHRLKIPVKPQNLTLERASRTAGVSPEYELSEEIAEELIRTIVGFGRALERSVLSANQLLNSAEEEVIRDLLLFILNANWQGLATGETFIQDGKCDILLRYENRDAFIAECKIWKGEKTAVEGLDQLLTRYVPWRACRAVLILFVRDRIDITKIVQKANAAIESSVHYVETLAGDSVDRSEFVVRSVADQQRKIRLCLLPFIIPNVGSEG